MTPSRVEELIESLGLQPHPEGGHYLQTFRSTARVAPADGRGMRSALTTIYFLLPEGAVSRWHRVRSDEVWHFYEGAPLELFEMADDLSEVVTHRLGPLAGLQAPVLTICAGHWQAARSMGAYTLAGCTVGPGFEFEDFTILADAPDLAADLRTRFPAEARYL